MEEHESPEPWTELEQLVEQGESAAVQAYLISLPPGEVARTLARMSEEGRAHIFRTLDPGLLADLLTQIPDVQAIEVIQQLEPEAAASILNELRSDEQADLLGDLEDADAEAILREMEPEASVDARALTRYEDDVAGGLMVTEYLAYPEEYTVSQVVNDMRHNAEKYRDYNIQYAYVVAHDGRLAGVLRLRDLLLADDAQRIHDLVVRDPLTVSDMAPLDDLRDLFDRYPYFGLPVVDGWGRLVGVVQREDVEEALADKVQSDYQKSQGIVSGEELRTMPLLVRSRRRLSWLSVNILLNVLAASVIAFHQDTLASVIALAVFLPIISDMSGCSGNQAVAVSMRELSLGLVRPPEIIRVLAKESMVGLINGVALGVLIGAVAWLWKGNPFLGLVVGGALALNTVVAVSLGGMLPLALRRMKMDPALASGPILTTITDMCGFLLVLSFASWTLPRLT